MYTPLGRTDGDLLFINRLGHYSIRPCRPGVGFGPVFLSLFNIITSLEPVLGNTLLEVAGVVLPLPSSLLILYSRELILYSIFYSETHYSTQILLKNIEKF